MFFFLLKSGSLCRLVIFSINILAPNQHCNCFGGKGVKGRPSFHQEANQGSSYCKVSHYVTYLLHIFILGKGELTHDRLRCSLFNSKHPNCIIWMCFVKKLIPIWEICVYKMHYKMVNLLLSLISRQVYLPACLHLPTNSRWSWHSGDEPEQTFLENQL